MMNFKQFIKKYFPKLFNISGPARNFVNKKFRSESISVNFIDKFFEFSPNVTGTVSDRTKSTIFSIKNYAPVLNSLIEKPIPLDNMNNIEETSESMVLKNLFEKYKSDKSTHNYHLVYSKYLNPLKVNNLLEIGLGTNNTDVMSNMSKLGNPGASLFAFRDFLPNSTIWGADIDKSVLFQETRIKTLFLDQLDINSIDSFINKFSVQFDIIIDDGFHSIISNINSIFIAKHILLKNGLLIIEDIRLDNLPMINVAINLVKEDFETKIYTNPNMAVAVLKKIK